VVRDFGPGAAGDEAVPFLSPQPMSGTAGTVRTGPPIILPGADTVYVTTENVRWQTTLWQQPAGEFFPIATYTSRSYRAGRTYQERFNHPVFGPGLPPAETPWAYRMGDTVSVNLPLFTDSGGNAGIVRARTGSTKLYLGDQLVGESPLGGWAPSPTCRRPAVTTGSSRRRPVPTGSG
jgi:hypothetical protein